MSKQNWEIGQTVKVGFISGLTVLAKIPTPGDYVYILAKGAAYYSFVPYNGLTRIDEEQVAQMIVEGKRIKDREREEAAAREEKLGLAKIFQKKVMEEL